MKITMIVLSGCPYCIQARELIKELKEEHPVYKKIEIEEVNETAQPELIATLDYYYCPSFFDGKEKLYEASPAWSREEAKTKLNHMFETLVG